jgi:predicted nucleic acid-binding protein
MKSVDRDAAKVRSNEDLPMADSLIAATSIVSKAMCITDSPHFDKILLVKCKWI